MINIDSPETAAYLLKREQTLYGRLLLNRLFVGTLIQVAGSGPWQVQVTRVGETTSDGHWYNCSVPGYTPRIGDAAVFVWQDQDVGHLLFPLASTVPPLVSQMARLTPSVSLGAAVASVSFSNIPPNFTHLWCSWRARCTAGGASTLQLLLNSDNGGNYNTDVVTALGTDSPGSAFVATTGLSQTSIRVGGIGTAGNLMGAGSFYVYDYSRTGNRRMLTWTGWRNDGGGLGTEWGSSDWANTTDPVSSLSLLAGSGNLDAGCLFTLYGI